MTLQHSTGHQAEVQGQKDQICPPGHAWLTIAGREQIAVTLHQTVRMEPSTLLDSAKSLGEKSHFGMCGDTSYGLESRVYATLR